MEEVSQEEREVLTLGRGGHRQRIHSYVILLISTSEDVLYAAAKHINDDWNIPVRVAPEFSALVAPPSDASTAREAVEVSWIQDFGTGYYHEALENDDE